MSFPWYEISGDFIYFYLNFFLILIRTYTFFILKFKIKLLKRLTKKKKKHIFYDVLNMKWINLFLSLTVLPK